MATIAFDGPNKTITIGYDAAITEVDAYVIYSEWKDWVVAGNSQYLPAFDNSVGGNPVSATLSLGAFVFLRNDLGWRIVPANTNHELRVNGDIYPTDASLGMFAPPATASVLSVVQRSATSLAVETGVSGLTPDEALSLSLILKILRNKRVTDPSNGTQRIYDDNDVEVLMEGSLFEDVAGTVPYGTQSTRVDRADRMV
jgi:hypothetical protein